MRHEAAQPRDVRTWRFRRRKASTHGWLHDEKWGDQCGGAHDEGRAQCGTFEPSWSPDDQQECREEDADAIVRAPPDDPLVTNRRRRTDVLVLETTVPKVAYPATQERVVERRHAPAPQKRQP